MGFPIPIIEMPAGSTLKATWINSGVTPSSLQSLLLDPTETLVGSAVAGVSSGNGHYYAPHFVPTSYPWYVNRWIAYIDARTYQHVQLVRALKLEV